MITWLPNHKKGNTILWSWLPPTGPSFTFRLGIWTCEWNPLHILPCECMVEVIEMPSFVCTYTFYATYERNHIQLIVKWWLLGHTWQQQHSSVFYVSTWFPTHRRHHHCIIMTTPHLAHTICWYGSSGFMCVYLTPHSENTTHFLSWLLPTWPILYI